MYPEDSPIGMRLQGITLSQLQAIHNVSPQPLRVFRNTSQHTQQLRRVSLQTLEPRIGMFFAVF
jgi:hypothetical protein